MNDTNEYFNDLVDQVKRKLPEYISSNGRRINTNGTYQCFNTSAHANGDTDFSANVGKSNGIDVWHCHVCKTGGSIYDLACQVEGLPVKGEGFIHTTVELATRFGISVDKTKIPAISDKNIARFTMPEIYKEIDQYIKTYGEGAKHLTEGRFGREYTKEQAEKILEYINVGCVDSRDLTKAMREKFGDRIEELEFYDDETKLFQPYLFNMNHLVMPVRDRRGIPVAFSGRVSEEYRKAASIRVPKYVHTKGFEGLKKQSMFLIDAAKEEIKKTKTVRFVEGAFDAITMHLFGFRNTVSILGSSIQQDMIDQLAAMKVYSLIFILDPDKAGINALYKALPELNLYDMTADAVVLPDGEDPDSILRSGNTDAMLAKRDAVMVVLERYHDFHESLIPADSRYKMMIKFITSSSPHSAKYREYASVMANWFGYHEEDILENIRDFAENHRNISDEERKLNDTLSKAVNLPLSERIVVIEDTAVAYRSISADLAKKTGVTTWQEFMSLVNGNEKFPKILRTGYRLDKYADIECGALTFVSGWPSNGKSSVLQHMAITMARNNRDLKVLYVATDDVPRKAMASFIGIITGMPKRTVKELIEQGQFLGNPMVDMKLDEIQDLFTNQIILKGLKDCSSTDKVKQEISHIRKSHSKDLLVVVDAMNNLDDIKKDDQRVGIENAIRNFKNMAVTYDAALIPVSHLTKQDGKEGERPRLKNLKGTSFIEYEAKTVLLVHMDAHYNKATDLRWKSGNTLFPVVEINVAKDKDQEANNIVPVLFNPLTGEIMSPSDALHDKYIKYIEGATSSNSYSGDSDGLFDN